MRVLVVCLLFSNLVLARPQRELQFKSLKKTNRDNESYIENFNKLQTLNDLILINNYDRYTNTFRKQLYPASEMIRSVYDFYKNSYSFLLNKSVNSLNPRFSSDYKKIQILKSKNYSDEFIRLKCEIHNDIIDRNSRNESKIFSRILENSNINIFYSLFKASESIACNNTIQTHKVDIKKQVLSEANYRCGIELSNLNLNAMQRIDDFYAAVVLSLDEVLTDDNDFYRHKRYFYQLSTKLLGNIFSANLACKSKNLVLNEIIEAQDPNNFNVIDFGSTNLYQETKLIDPRMILRKL